MDEDFLSKYFSEEDSKFYFFCTERLSSTPIDIKLPDTCIGNRKIDIPEAYFNTKKLKRDLQKARKNFDDFSPITIQCPIYISRKSGKEYKQNFNVYIQKIEQGSTSKYLLLRQSLTLSAENNLTGIPGPVYAITSIQKPHVAKMLKSAEVPSHVYAKYTNASDAGYKYARETLSIIRNAANEIAKLLYNFESEIDLNSLSQLFPIAHSGSGAAGWVDPSSHKDKCLNCNQHPCICPKPLQQYIVKYISPGSYRVTNGRDPIKIFPFKIHLKFAFGTLAPGNQIKKYKPTDFDLSNAQAIDPNNLEVLRQGNDLILEIDSSSANFNYEISGLNTNFEFIIEGQL